ncbi:MAG: hypothetical protein HQK51_07135 [Oligoflexia bacterium]|nr:hypothetical protein [Oligoflexia bacterium]
MKKSIFHIYIWILIIYLFTSFTSGCLNTKYSPRKEYLLNIPAPISNSISSLTKNSPFKKSTLFVDKVTIVSPYNQLDFIYRVSSFEYLTDYYNGFMISPENQADTALIKYLDNSALFKSLVSLSEMTKANEVETVFKLQTEITEILADYRDRNNPKAVVSIHFIIKKIKPRNSNVVVLFDKTLSSSIPIKKKDTESLCSAWNKCFQNIFEQLIQHIQYLKT